MLQEFWSTLHDIDKSLWVVGPKLTSRASCSRQVNLGIFYNNFDSNFFLFMFCVKLLQFFASWREWLHFTPVLKCPQSSIFTRVRIQSKSFTATPYMEFHYWLFKFDHVKSCRCRFLGPDSAISSLRITWSRKCKNWCELICLPCYIVYDLMEWMTWKYYSFGSHIICRAKEKSFADNLASILGFELPKPQDTQKNQELECGICYAQCLPIGNK